MTERVSQAIETVLVHGVPFPEIRGRTDDDAAAHADSAPPRGNAHQGNYSIEELGAGKNR
jgi:hypothetical protein